MNAWEEEVLARQEAMREKQLEIAKKMKLEGLTIGMISKITELTEEEIECLE